MCIYACTRKIPVHMYMHVYTKYLYMSMWVYAQYLQVRTCACHVCRAVMSPGLDSFSEWLKSKPSTSADSTRSPQSPSSSSSTASQPAVYQTRDRLLHSEIRELQAKLAQLGKENHELRQLLKASGDDSRSALLGRQVCVYII